MEFIDIKTILEGTPQNWCKNLKIIVANLS